MRHIQRARFRRAARRIRRSACRSAASARRFGPPRSALPLAIEIPAIPAWQRASCDPASADDRMRGQGITPTGFVARSVPVDSDRAARALGAAASGRERQRRAPSGTVASMSRRAGRPLARGNDRAGPSKHLAHSCGRCCFASRRRHRDQAPSASRCIDLWTAGAMQCSSPQRSARPLILVLSGSGRTFCRTATDRRLS
jgi:hypothetical protein